MLRPLSILYLKCLLTVPRQSNLIYAFLKILVNFNYFSKVTELVTTHIFYLESEENKLVIFKFPKMCIPYIY